MYFNGMIYILDMFGALLLCDNEIVSIVYLLAFKLCFQIMF